MDAKKCCDVNAPKEGCCQGRNCPNRTPYSIGPLLGLVAVLVSSWIVIGAIVEALL